MYLVLYEFYKTKTKTLSATWAAWMFAVAMVGAPWLFNPQCFSFTNIKASAEEIQHWLLGKVRVRVRVRVRIRVRVRVRVKVMVLG